MAVTSPVPPLDLLGQLGAGVLMFVGLRRPRRHVPPNEIAAQLRSEVPG